MESDLSAFPRPHVAVDIALLTVRPSHDRLELVTLIQDRTEELGGHTIPGRFIRERRTVAQTVDELLQLEVGISLGRRRPHPLRVYDDPDRDTRAWGLSIATWLALPWNDVAHAAGTWRPISSSGTPRGIKLLFAHDQIVREAVVQLRDLYETLPDPERLLAGPFTLLDLRHLHEAVLGERLRKDTFNRRMREQLDPIGRDTTSLSAPAAPHSVNAGRRGRPAQLYRQPRRTAHHNGGHWRLPRAQ
jgi:ADP-ribose pyrophosphatase YjhB (NUDIX family)